MWDYKGIKERFDQLQNASDSIKYRGLKNLDKLISIEIDEAETREQINTLLTYRRKTRLALKKVSRIIKSEAITLKTLFKKGKEKENEKIF